MAVALVVSVVVPPDDDDVAVDDEDEAEFDTETDETDELDEEVEDEELVTEPGLPGVPETVRDPEVPDPVVELPGEREACLIVLNTPCRHSIAANCPEENPETEKRGPTRHAR